MTNLVSVVIPTYKRPYQTLLRAVKSVLEQSYGNIEVIIVDDSPLDDINRKEVETNVKSIKDKRVKYIQHKNNQGACKARNTGIRYSSGTFIAFLDDDDEWLPQKIEMQLRKFNDEKVGLVYCDSNTITVSGSKVMKSKIRAHRIAGWVFDRLIINNFIGSTSFVIIRREIIDNCGLFKTDMKSAQDAEFWLRISKKYKVDFVDEPLVNYYIHEGDRISTNIANKIQGLEKINEINKSYLMENRKALCIRKLKIIPYYQLQYGNKIAIEKWVEAFKIYPLHFKNVEYLIRIYLKKR